MQGYHFLLIKEKVWSASNQPIYKNATVLTNRAQRRGSAVIASAITCVCVNCLPVVFRMTRSARLTVHLSILLNWWRPAKFN